MERNVYLNKSANELTLSMKFFFSKLALREFNSNIIQTDFANEMAIRINSK